ncbi:hypothetical protein AXF42_Ash005403 [Apostasia shenzhenica]|uniref:Uncharacterized protein n=1 Tax=Apostasia shenzhenica TaxID=1088818 RepID=A0A2I0B6T1_9ASPA|nr:hypothetical protein AXF42_Ash005403 [Apostasia shenzhenica]
MMHTTGSRPFREFMYEDGGNKGCPPNVAELFFETRKKEGKLTKEDCITKHVRFSSY